MNYFHWGARMLGKSSPALLLIGGAALALFSQPVRTGLHRLAVQTTKGILIVNDEVKKLAVKMKEQNVDNESEAPVNKWSCSKGHGRPIAVAAVGTIVTKKEKAGAVCNGFTSIVEEARKRHEIKRSGAADGELPNEPYQLTGKHKVQNRSDKRQIVAQKIQSKFN